MKTRSLLQCAAVRCSALQCVAVCCNVLQCVAVCCFFSTHPLTHPPPPHPQAPPRAEIASPASSVGSRHSRPSSIARPIATPTRHVRAKFVQAKSRDEAALRGAPSAAVTELMTFQTQTLNQKLVRGLGGRNSHGGRGGGADASASTRGSHGAAASVGGLSVEGQGGQRVGSSSGQSGPAAALRVNNFFLA